MQSPRIEVVPGRPAVSKDQPIQLDVLIRIIPPLPEVHLIRPPINLGIVLDRSGSMSGQRKITQAKQAAKFAISQMLSTDRASVTIFDSEVETIVPSTMVEEKATILAKIDQVYPGGSTALHGGWKAGAEQVREHRILQGINRVILLSDGLANHGLTDEVAICTEVQGMAAHEVSTSTIGVGSDYNEQLMSCMAQAGQGNYYFVDNPVQLADIFQSELKGLMATTGRRVELELVPAQGIGPFEVLTELERGPSGEIRLPDLVAEMPISVLVRISIPPRKAGSSEVCQVRLSWAPTGADHSSRQTAEVRLALHSLSQDEWEKLPIDPAVQEQLVVISATKCRDEYQEAIRRGDYQQAREVIGQIRTKFDAVPQTAEVADELANLMAMERELGSGNITGSAKHAHHRAYLKKRGLSQQPPEPPKTK